MPECLVERSVGTPLICMLPEGHEGLHWDGEENVSWKVGNPDE